MNKSVYDLETLQNCFIACFEDYKTNEDKVFVVHDLRNDFKEFVDFIKLIKQKKGWLISFNGINFDSQILEYVFANYEEWKDFTGCQFCSKNH